jgi:Membrane-associated phospholipid phosphatase
VKTIGSARRDPVAPAGHAEQPNALRASTVLSWAMAFLALALTAIAATGHPTPGDQLTAPAIQSFPGGGFLEEPADLLAQPLVEFLVWLAAAALAWRTGRTDLLIAGVIVALALGTNPLIKDLVERSRPASSQLTIRETATGYGFPSGHTEAATLIYGFLAYSYFSTTAAARWLVALGSASAVLLIGLDRVYNGVHWPSDVVGGFAFGVVLLAICVTAGHHLDDFLKRGGSS